ncbi:DUF305 domain-containing protein [Actinophytocola glycyrrhizae]|uniref:DUF305 domain-containing protein n=1 Tax=Actinophytocola glycyrrhizae TaxID=2044873 RepID=A0ABV9S6N8_9PSEU
MRATNWTYRLARAGAGVLVTLGVLGGCTAAPPPTNSAPVIVPGAPGEEASTIPPGEATVSEQPGPNDADKKFVKDMIVHHRQAVHMAGLAPERASSSDVKGLASRIHDVQGPEIDMMNRWLSQHAIPTVNPDAPHGHGGGAMPGMATDEQLAELEKARGDGFDTLFLQLMIAHHQGALTMADEVRKNGMDIRVQEIADDVTAEQSDEIRRMRKWLDG